MAEPPVSVGAFQDTTAASGLGVAVTAVGGPGIGGSGSALVGVMGSEGSECSEPPHWVWAVTVKV